MERLDRVSEIEQRADHFSGRSGIFVDDPITLGVLVEKNNPLLSTEQICKNQQLRREATQQKDKVEGFSHDLRSLLTNIHLASVMLSKHEDLLSNEARHELLGEIVFSSNCLNETMDNIREKRIYIY